MTLDASAVAKRMKLLIGENGLLKDMETLVADRKVCANVSVRGDDHAVFALSKSEFDVEALLSLIFEYAFYIASNERKLYDDIVTIASTYAKSVSHLLVAVLTPFPSQL